MKVLIAIQDAKCVDVLGAFVRNYPWPSSVQFKVLHVVHPVLVNSFMSLLPAPLTESIHEERVKEGETIVNRLVESIRESMPSASAEPELIEGDARSEIVDALKEWDADLILLGSHGKTGLMGSVSRAIVSHSPCSAMVVPIDARARKQTKDKIHIIV